MTIRSSAVLVLALAAAAASAPAARPTWADWVGDYEGELAWKGCFTPGAARARISLDAIDGAMFIDLVDAGGGLRAMSVVEEEGGWSAQQGDVKLRVLRPRAHALYVAVEIGSDCAMKGNLVRPSTKIAACDRLIGWARVEATCGKLGSAPLAAPAKLATESKKWKPRVKAEVARCEQRAVALETSLVAVGCAPVADPQALVPGPQCQALQAAVAKLRRCPTASRMTIDLAGQLAQVPSVGGTAAEREHVEADCSRLRRQAASLANAERCPL